MPAGGYQPQFGNIIQVIYPNHANPGSLINITGTIKNTSVGEGIFFVRLLRGEEVLFQVSPIFLYPNDKAILDIPTTMPNQASFFVMQGGHWVEEFGGQLIQIIDDAVKIAINIERIFVDGIEAPLLATDAIVLSTLLPAGTTLGAELVPDEDAIMRVIKPIVETISGVKLLQVNFVGTKLILWLQSPFAWAELALLLIKIAAAVLIIGLIVWGARGIILGTKEVERDIIREKAQVTTEALDLKQKILADPTLTPEQKIELTKTLDQNLKTFLEKTATGIPTWVVALAAGGVALGLGVLLTRSNIHIPYLATRSKR